MANSLYGYTDSFTTNGIMLPLIALDYDKDFAVSHDGDAVVLSNITTPVDQPETLRYAQYDVANVYKNTNIQPIHRENGVRGKKNIISLLDTARVTLGDGTIVDYPVKASISIEYPLSGNISSADIWSVVKRCVAATQDYAKVAVLDSSKNGVADSTLLNQEFRGGLNPQDGKTLSTRTS